jgi:hypothetical protein
MPVLSPNPHQRDSSADDIEHAVGYLTGAAPERGKRPVIDERDEQWFVEARGPSGLGGEVVILGVNDPDRRTAMLKLPQT